jgi:hypothetical protein
MTPDQKPIKYVTVAIIPVPAPHLLALTNEA